MMKLAKGRPTGLLAVGLDTWRLAWRDPLTRVEILLLLVLTLFSSIATVGSPSVGDGAIQMFAIAYAVTPFALVLLIGQIGRNVDAEVAWWSRPLSRESYYLGRFLGYIAVGACIVALAGGAGALLMAAIGGFALGPTVAWNAWFALATLPGLVTVSGASLFLLQRTGPGIRYFTPAILISLALAFADYKWSAMAAALPHLDFWNPFPGFLTLGLALPPRLLGMPPVTGWIWLNRLLYIGVGLCFLAGAIATGGRHGFRYPLRHRMAARASAIAAAAAVIACGLVLHGIASSLSPGLLAAILPADAPTPAAAAPDGPPAVARASVGVSLTVNPTSGAVHGRAIYRHLAGRRITFELNAGLTPVSVRTGGHPLPVRRAAAGRRVLPHTAASLWSVSLPKRTAGTLAITYRGFLLPRASTLPYPPFALGRVYDTMEAGHGRFFLNGLGTWLPLVVDRAGSPIPGIREGALRLALSGATPNATTITNMRVLPTAPGWGGMIGRSVLMVAPYAVTALAFAEDLSAVQPSGESLSTAQLYAAAWRSLEAVLPGKERTLEIAYSPVAESPELVGNILVASDLHPYQLPTDPVSGSTTATPTPEHCLGELVSLWWSERIHRAAVGLFPRPATRLQSEAWHVLAALDLLYLTPEGERPLVTGDLRRGDLPGIGRLSSTEQRETQALWREVHRLSYRGWKRLRAAAAERVADPTATWASVAGAFAKLPQAAAAHRSLDSGES